LDKTKPLYQLGHIHTHQKRFLGSPMPYDFGDVNHKYYFLGESGIDYKCHKFDNYNDFQTIKIDFALDEEIEDVQRKIDETLNDPFIRLLVNNVYKGYRLDIEYVRSLLPDGVKLVNKKVTQREEVRVMVNLDKTFSLKDSLNKHHEDNDTDQAQREFELDLLVGAGK